LWAALMILLAYGGHQTGCMDSRSALYNILNAIGSGFVLLEGAWVLISLYVLLPPKKIVAQ
jgi:hypothetical protein